MKIKARSYEVWCCLDFVLRHVWSITVLVVVLVVYPWYFGGVCVCGARTYVDPCGFVGPCRHVYPGFPLVYLRTFTATPLLLAYGCPGNLTSTGLPSLLNGLLVLIQFLTWPW